MNKLVINKENLLQNVQKIKEHAQTNLPDDKGNPVKIIVVVKSNAYGLELKQYVQFMVNQGFDFFAVSTVQEAVEFRKLGFTQQVLMLSSTGIKEEIKTLIENNIIITIGSKETVDTVCTISKEMPEKKIKAHIDGVNAGQQAKDSQIIEQVIKDNEKLPIDMSRGGGYTGIIHIEK